MNSVRVGYLLAALAAVGVAVWFFTNFDRVTEQVYVGYRGEARRNPTLAAGRLFVRLGAKARELESLRELAELPRGGVLVLPAGRASLGNPQIESLLAWVERGGRLVAEATSVSERDPLFVRLGVARVASEGREQCTGSACGPAEAPVLWVPGRGELLVAAFGDGTRLRLPKRGVRWTADTRAGEQVAALDRGRGEILVATSLDFMRNRSIGLNDHAELSWFLVGEGTAPEIRFYNQPQRLSLLDWLLENAAPALGGGALLVALWLWRLVPRFGPMAPEPAPGRRRLLEHLRAVGRHQWTTGNAPRLYAAAREACLARVHRAHPEMAALAPEARASRLAEVFGLPPSAVEHALAPTPPDDANSFTRAVSTLQAFHDRLARISRAARKRGTT